METQEILTLINQHPFFAIAVVFGLIILIHRVLHKKAGKPNKEPEANNNPATNPQDALEALQKETGMENVEDVVDLSYKQIERLNRNVKRLMLKYNKKLNHIKEKISNEEQEIREKAKIMIDRKNRLLKAKQELNKNLNLTNIGEK